jgi:hypothetical protein
MKDVILFIHILSQQQKIKDQQQKTHIQLNKTKENQNVSRTCSFKFWKKIKKLTLSIEM